ncbi:MAG: YidC/Oxa1 family membrane protein insertase [Clostridiales bacterium]|nr:YidC/Oxa1 family membrane protein insertase [Clostridiales bacterium]
MISTPLGSLLSFIFNFTHNYALSIIILTILIKVVLFPLSITQIKSTKKMGVIQPKIKELQAKYKNDKEQLNIKTMELYKENKINPLSGCLPMLIQLPILFGLFAVLRDPTTHVFNGSVELSAAALGQGFLWVKDLSMPDLISNVWPAGPSFLIGLPGILPILSSISTYIQMSTMSTTQNSTTKTMAYTMPLMILWFGKTFTAGLMIYWTVSNLFQMVQQYFTNKVYKV